MIFNIFCLLPLHLLFQFFNSTQTFGQNTTNKSCLNQIVKDLIIYANFCDMVYTEDDDNILIGTYLFEFN